MWSSIYASAEVGPSLWSGSSCLFSNVSAAKSQPVSHISYKPHRHAAKLMNRQGSSPWNVACRNGSDTSNWQTRRSVKNISLGNDTYARLEERVASGSPTRRVLNAGFIPGASGGSAWLGLHPQEANSMSTGQTCGFSRVCRATTLRRLLAGAEAANPYKAIPSTRPGIPGRRIASGGGATPCSR